MHMPTKKQRISDISDKDATWDEFIIHGSESVTTGKTLQLNQGESIVVVGEGVLVVEQGCVVVNGFLVTEKGRTIPLRCDESFPIYIESGGGGPWDELEMGGPYVAAQYAVVRLEKTPNSGTNLRVVKLPKRLCDVYYPKEWVEVCRDIVTRMKEFQSGSKQVICVCGAKNTGKSSFCRYLVNTLLRRYKTIQYLDMDCGQPEFTPPGLVSLVEVVEPILEPPYLQTAVTVMSHFVGDTSPALDTEMYVKYVDSLYRYACRKKHVMIVNTNGWIQGMGMDVLRQCLSGMALTHLVRLHGDSARTNLIPSSLFANTRDNQPLDYVLPAISCAAPSCIAAREMRDCIASDASLTRVTSAAENRCAQWNKFCLQCCAQQITSRAIFSDDIAMQLASYKPYGICLDDIVVLSSFSDWQTQQAIPRVLNGSIVGLCSVKRDEHGPASITDREPLMRCFGMGILRSVVPETNSLYLLTPLPETDLALVDCLVIGKLDLPPNLLQTNGLKSPYLAIHGLSAGGTAAGHGKSRNNLQRQRTLVQ